MIHRLYTQEDNARLNALMDTVANNSALMDSVTATLEGTEKAQDISEPSKDGFTALISKPALLVSFTHKGNQGVKWNVDKSLLAPSVATQMSGKSFAEAYLAQLNKILYHTNEEPPMQALFDLMHLHNLTKTSKVVKVKSARYVQRLPLICSTLTEYFNTNRHVISSISTMVANQLTESTS